MFPFCYSDFLLSSEHRALEKMVYFWSSFLGATQNESDFEWSQCPYCHVKGAQLLIRDHKTVCEKRPTHCLYCSFSGPADIVRHHMVSCQHKDSLLSRLLFRKLQIAYPLPEAPL